MTTTTSPRATRARNRKAAKEIIQRVAAVPGWKIVETPGGKGFEVVSPRLDAVSVHAVPGDWDFADEVWRALEAAGFLADEEKSQKDTQAKADADAESTRHRDRNEQAAAARRASEEQARKARVIKAAGPYLVEPETVELDWFIRRHPAPWMRWVWITPFIAKYLLTHHNTHNRPIYQATVMEYRTKIRKNMWALTHQGMAMDTDAVLQDAQHRLKAIEEEGESNPDLRIPVAFFVGMPPENFMHVDEGRNRRAQDLIARDLESYATLLAGATRLILAYDTKQPRKSIKTRTANATIYERFNDDQEPLRHAVRFATNHYKRLKIGPSPLAAAHYLLSKKNGADNPYLLAFFEGFGLGHKPNRQLLDVLDPREVLRNQFANWRDARKRVDGLSTLCLIILAWNNVVQNREPRVIAFNEKSDIPDILLCLPGETVPPMALRGEIVQPGEAE